MCKQFYVCRREGNVITAYESGAYVNEDVNVIGRYSIIECTIELVFWIEPFHSHENVLPKNLIDLITVSHSNTESLVHFFSISLFHSEIFLLLSSCFQREREREKARKEIERKKARKEIERKST